jgi:hypothetical protein
VTWFFNSSIRGSGPVVLTGVIRPAGMVVGTVVRGGAECDVVVVTGTRLVVGATGLVVDVATGAGVVVVVDPIVGAEVVGGGAGRCWC